MGAKKYKYGFVVTVHPEALREPIRWKKPSLEFVNSMSDLFHKSSSLGLYRIGICNHERGVSAYVSSAYQTSRSRCAARWTAELDAEYLAWHKY